MKAKVILNDTLKMLGYGESNGNAEFTQRLRSNAVVMINLVYGDLWRIFNKGDFEPIKTLDDEIKLPNSAVGDVFWYGLAMHLARSENDGDQQQFYTLLYNSKRAGLTQYSKVKNVIPRGADQ